MVRSTTVVFAEFTSVIFPPEINISRPTVMLNVVVVASVKVKLLVVVTIKSRPTVVRFPDKLKDTVIAALQVKSEKDCVKLAAAGGVPGDPVIRQLDPVVHVAVMIEPPPALLCSYVPVAPTVMVAPVCTILFAVEFFNLPFTAMVEPEFNVAVPETRSSTATVLMVSAVATDKLPFMLTVPRTLVIVSVAKDAAAAIDCALAPLKTTVLVPTVNAPAPGVKLPQIPVVPLLDQTREPPVVFRLP